MKDHVDFWHKTHWFAVETKAYHESLAAKRVDKLGLEVFLPRMKIDQAVCGVVRSVAKALFPGYFFARFCPVLSLDAVRHSHGVCRIVGSKNIPIAVCDEVIEKLQGRIEEDGFICIRPPSLEPGSRVSILSGPFEGFVGTVLSETNDRRRVAVLLETLLSARVLIERRWLEVEAA